MGALTIAMFAGITALALVTHVHVADDPALLIGAPDGYEQRTAIAQVAGAVFGYDSVGSSSWCRGSPRRSWCWPRTPRSTVS